LVVYLGLLKGLNMKKNEFVEKYASAEVEFESYYKYTFVYAGTLEDGSHIRVWEGGDADDIYRHDVCANTKYTVGKMYLYAGEVRDSNGETVASF
jgi:hypothetical protein